tara:strand:+ start:194 stop:427 length:234 start_codon:yes stop_codon:yes gene_type:complete
MASRKVVKEFLGALMNKIAAKKGKQAAKNILKSPEVKRLAAKAQSAGDELTRELEKKAAAGDPGAKNLLDMMKKLGI